MHVLMISLDTAILTQSIGDARQRHIDYAARAGHITTIVCSRRVEGLRRAELSPHLTAIPTNSRSRLMFAWDAYRLAAQAHRARQADVVTAQDPFGTGLVGWMLKRRFGLPLALQNHSTFIDNPDFLGEHPLRNRLFNRLAKFVIPRGDTHRVTNSREREKYIALGVDPARIGVIPVPVNLDLFRGPFPAQDIAALRARLGLRPEHRVALWVGRPVSFKNLPLLFQAVDRARRVVPDVRLVLVGDFSKARDLRQQALALLGDAAIFAGALPHAELPLYYAMSQVYALSSRYEGMPRVAIEAAAAGLPIVSTNIAAVQDAIIDGETGFLTRAGDPDDMGEKLTLLLRDPELARNMGARAHQHVCERFDPDKLTEALLDTWRFTAALGKREAL